MFVPGAMNDAPMRDAPMRDATPTVDCTGTHT